jgi:hypothetical protein
MGDPLALFGKSLDARISYEAKVTDAMRRCEQDVERARARLQRDKLELQRCYEDEIQHAYETHGNAPLSPRDSANIFFHKQLNQLQRQQVVLNDRIVALEQHSVSPRTVQRLRETYRAERVITPRTQQRLQESYTADLDERIDLIRANLDTADSPPGSPQSQELPLTPRTGLVPGYVSADGQPLSLSLQNKAEPEPEVCPDPQLCAEGASGGASSADGA